MRKLSPVDANEIFNIVNEAAVAYKGHIPADRYHEPYMPKQELLQEMESVTFFGWEENGDLVGVMGIQPVKDVTLIRHAYVLPGYQGKGIGQRLLAHLKEITSTGQLLVGTWAAATWAVGFYQNLGFKLAPNKDELLKKYWDIPQRQIDTSVVLVLETGKGLSRPGGQTEWTKPV